MRRFGFTDSSGILSKDQLFGVGLLVVKNVGDLGDKLYKNSQPVKELVKKGKNQSIEQLLSLGRQDEVIKMLRNSYKFEMKFDTVGNKTTLPFYESMVDIFFADADNRFSAMIINKAHPEFKADGIEDSWETYTKYVASLVVREMRSLPEDEFCLVIDEISKPQSKALSLEDTILSKIRNEAASDSTINANNIFGAVTIESHSNLLMQLCDVLLGAVMYDYKRKHGLSSQKTQRKKEHFVQKVRSSLQVDTLASEFSLNPTAFFSVSDSI